MKTTWKEKAEALGIELKPVFNNSGEVIENQFDFEFKGEFCKTWIDKDNHRAYCCKNDKNDYYGSGKFTNDFDYFINEFDRFRPERE